MSLWIDYIPHFWTINQYQHDNVRQNHTAKITKWDHKLTRYSPPPKLPLDTSMREVGSYIRSLKKIVEIPLQLFYSLYVQPNLKLISE